MASFNKVIVMGNLTKDPEVRHTPNNTAVADIGLAVNRTWFDKASNQKKEDVTFVDVTLWGRQAEVAGEYLSKGSSVLIEGRLQLDQWDDRETGKKRSKLKVVCENLTLVGGRSSSGGGGNGSNRGGSGAASSQSRGSAPQQQSASTSAGASPSSDSFYENPPVTIPDDEVPF